MSYLSVILLAFALSIDACTVSFSCGLKYRNNRKKNSLNLALVTGCFQGLMPVLGYFLTNQIKLYIQTFSNIIVFLIFVLLGIKFIKEAFRQKKQENCCIDIKYLILIGIATSIDAFAAGISLSLFGNRILKPALLIAFVTFINSLLGFNISTKLKHLPTKVLEISAGMILILLGIKAII